MDERPTEQRPHRRRKPRFSEVLAIFAVLGVLGYVTLPPLQRAANATAGAVIEEARRRVNPRYVVLAEGRVTATTSASTHPVGLAFDGGTNTYWSTSESQPTIEVELPAAVHIGAIVLYPGVRSQPEAFRTPSSLEIASVDTGASVTVPVLPGVDRQDVVFDLPDTGALRIRVVASHGEGSLPLAISEIEVNGRE